MSSLRTLTALLVGGFVGTVLRALLVDGWVHDPSAWPWGTFVDGWVHDPSAWPWGTFVVNVVGALLLGVVVALLRARPTASLYWRPLLGTGLCGGLTTFSTLQLELVRMVEADAVGLAAAYLAASLVLGLLAVVAGLRIGAAMPGPESIELDVPVDASATAPVRGRMPVDAARGDRVDRGRG